MCYLLWFVVLYYNYIVFLWFVVVTLVELNWIDSEELTRGRGAVEGGSLFEWRRAAARSRRKRGPRPNGTKTIAAIFPRGSKKRKSNNDDMHGHG